MKLDNILVEKRSTILEMWFDLMLESYPTEARDFLKKKKNRFDNPVAYEFRKGMKGIYETLFHSMERDKISSVLDRIISIGAIQDFLPSSVIGFIFLLKTAVRKGLEREIQENGLSEELLELESRIDRLALLSFDVFMNRREKLYELRVKEIKNRVSGLLRMAGLTSELDKEPELKEGTH
jgi:hypothetical protein